MSIRLPDKSFLWRMVARACVVWLALRVASLAPTGGLWASIPRAAGLPISLYVTVLVVVVTTALVTLDGRRRNEHMFLANLGVSLPTLFVLAAAPPTIMEIALSIGMWLW